jgi:hypothetical protein
VGCFVLRVQRHNPGHTLLNQLGEEVQGRGEREMDPTGAAQTVMAYAVLGYSPPAPAAHRLLRRAVAARDVVDPLHGKSSLRDAKSSLGDAKSSLRDAKSSLGDAKSSLGDAKSSLGDAKSSLGDAKSSLGDAKSSLGDAKSSLGDAESSLGDTLRARAG